MPKLKTKEYLFSKYTRQELTDLINEKDSQQSRAKTSKELNVSLYTLRVISKILGINNGYGRPQKGNVLSNEN